MLTIKKRFSYRRYLLLEGSVFAVFFAAMMTFMVNAIMPSEMELAMNKTEETRRESPKNQPKEDKQNVEADQSKKEKHTKNTGQSVIVQSTPIATNDAPAFTPKPSPSIKSSQLAIPTPAPRVTPGPTVEPPPTSTPDLMDDPESLF